jgi:secretion/DNA translocation related TadE-like protein
VDVSAEKQETGAAVVWALGLVSLLLLVGLASVAATAQVIARQRAATVADVAALAGAQATGDACATVERSVLANGMELADCAVDGQDVVVGVASAPPAVVVRLLGFLGRVPLPVRASARAGPPSP